MNFKKMVLAAVAMVFAFSAHSGELVKKKDSFAEAAPPNFAMAHAVEGQTCHRSGDIGMSTDGLILSCQSGRWKSSGGLHVDGPWSLSAKGKSTSLVLGEFSFCALTAYRESDPDGRCALSLVSGKWTLTARSGVSIQTKSCSAICAK